MILVATSFGEVASVMDHDSQCTNPNPRRSLRTCTHKFVNLECLGERHGVIALVVSEGCIAALGDDGGTESNILRHGKRLVHRPREYLFHHHKLSRDPLQNTTRTR